MRTSLHPLAIVLIIALVSLAKDVAGSPGTVDKTQCTSDSDCYMGTSPRYCRDGRCVYEDVAFEGDAANSTAAAVSAARESLSILMALLLVVGAWV